jgi:hypothetical protein
MWGNGCKNVSFRENIWSRVKDRTSQVMEKLRNILNLRILQNFYSVLKIREAGEISPLSDNILAKKKKTM